MWEGSPAAKSSFWIFTGTPSCFRPFALSGLFHRWPFLGAKSDAIRAGDTDLKCAKRVSLISCRDIIPAGTSDTRPIPTSPVRQRPCEGFAMKPSGKPLISMRKALADPRIFGGILKGKPWDPWRSVLNRRPWREPLEI